VTARLDPARFTIRTVPARFARRPDPLRPVLGPGIDMATGLARLEARLGATVPAATAARRIRAANPSRRRSGNVGASDR
jgi:bifunctional non-homologous end joining protein LigD